MVMDKHSSNSNHPTSQNTNTASADPPTPTDERLKATSASNGQSPNEYVFDEVLFTEAFKLFDAKKIGRVYKSDLIKVLRAAGHNPSAREMEEIYETYQIREGDMVQLDKAMKIARGRPIDNVDKIISAFRKFDRDSCGFISTEDMRTMLTSVGEKLTAQEVEELVEFADKHREGKVDYEEFARLIAPRPLTCLRMPQPAGGGTKNQVNVNVNHPA